MLFSVMCTTCSVDERKSTKTDLESHECPSRSKVSELPKVVLNLKPMRAAETPGQFVPLHGYIGFASMPTATTMQTRAKHLSGEPASRGSKQIPDSHSWS